MPQPPGDLTAYDSSLTQSQIAAKLASLDTRPGLAVKDEHARLLDHRSFLGVCPGFYTLLPLLDHRGFLVILHPDLKMPAACVTAEAFWVHVLTSVRLI